MAKPRNTILTSALLVSMAVFYGPALLAQTPPTIFDIANAPIPIQVLVQSPADTETDMQVICLFRSSAVNTMHGSLTEMNDKLKGLLDRIRKPDLFRPEAASARASCSSSGWAIRRHFPRNRCRW
jgi:hypothetical protein